MMRRRTADHVPHFHHFHRGGSETFGKPASKTVKLCEQLQIDARVT
jgi:hypothetical protein